MTDDVVARIRERRELGQTYRAIGNALGRSRQWVAMVCAEHGIERAIKPPKRLRPKVVPWVDPGKAAAVTESKKQFWGAA